MNIYEFFHSPDIAAHCQSINHQFSPLDMAIMVCLSEKKTLREKHAAYRQIIDEYPDMPIHRSVNFAARDSLHDYLRELIAYEEKVVAAIMATEASTVFQVYGRYRNCAHCFDTWEVDGFFSSFEGAKAAGYEEWDEQEEWDSLRIRKETVDGGENIPSLSVTLDRNGDILDYDYHDWETERMEMPSDIFFHLPVPFVKGDLITFDDDKPYVLRDIPQWEDGYEDFVRGKARDGSDMCAFVFYLRDDILEGDNGPPYMTWEMRYYKTELREQERFLKYLSSFVRNKCQRR